MKKYLNGPVEQVTKGKPQKHKRLPKPKMKQVQSILQDLVAKGIEQAIKDKLLPELKNLKMIVTYRMVKQTHMIYDVDDSDAVKSPHIFHCPVGTFLDMT
jgi:hypothetical protein